MPATQHQQDVLKTDDKAAQGHNMEAAGAGGNMPATKHQQEVLTKKPGTDSNRRSEAGALAMAATMQVAFAVAHFSPWTEPGWAIGN